MDAKTVLRVNTAEQLSKAPTGTVLLLKRDLAKRTQNVRVRTARLDARIDALGDDFLLDKMFQKYGEHFLNSVPIVGRICPDEGKFEVVQGMLRGEASERIDAPYLLAIVNEYASDAEVWQAKTDHGLETPLTLHFEVFLEIRATKLAFPAMSNIDLLTTCAGVIDEVHGQPKLEVREAVAKLKSAGDRAGAAKALYDSRNTVVMRYIKIAALPEQVSASYFMAEVGRPPLATDDPFSRDWKKADLPPGKLTDPQLTKLHKLFKEECENEQNVDDQGIPLFSRVKPGPVWRKLWNETVAAVREKASKRTAGTKRDKAMSAEDMKKELTESRWTFEAGFVPLTSHHAGNKGVDLEKLDKVDSECHLIVDILKSADPKAYRAALAAGEKHKPAYDAAREAKAKKDAKKPEKVSS